MNITPRTCASCVYFDPANEDGDTCPNLVHFTIRTPGKPDVSHGATASDWCDDHQTAEEAA